MDRVPDARRPSLTRAPVSPMGQSPVDSGIDYRPFDRGLFVTRRGDVPDPVDLHTS